MANSNNEMNRYTTPRLNDKNYKHWKLMLEMILIKENLWKTVKEAPPENPTVEWKKLDDSARATIILSLDEYQTHIVKGCTTAHQTWENIKKAKERKGLTNKRTIRRQLNASKMGSNQDMESYINEVIEMAYQLREMEEKIEDDQIISIILGGIPEEYDPLVTALDMLSTEELSLDYVKSKLIEEQYRKQNRTRENKASQAYWTNKTNQQSRRCFRCNGNDHIQRNCKFDVKEEPNRNTREQERTNKRVYYTEEQDERKKETQQTESEEQRSERAYVAFSAISKQNETDKTNNKWILDTGANAHMTSQINILQDISYLPEPGQVTLADGNTAQVIGTGKCYLSQDKNPTLPTIQLNEVLMIPDLKTNLISINQIAQLGFIVKFSKNKCEIFKAGQLVCQGESKEGVYSIDLSNTNREQANISCIHEWHKILGHRSLENIKSLTKHQIKNDFKIKDCNCSDECIACIKGSTTKLPYKDHPKENYDLPNKHLNADLCGPITPATIGNRKYFLTISDTYSKFTTTEILRSKDETSQYIIDFINQNFNKFNYYPQSFRSDGGGEFKNQTLDKFLTEHGIIHELSIPYSPQHNGVSERKSRSLLNMTRSMLAEKNLPKCLWGECILTATHIYNRLPHHTSKEIPYEKWNGIKPRYGKLKIFGSKVYYFIEKEFRGKFDNTAKAGIFVGYCKSQSGYRIWLPEERKVIARRNVIFSLFNSTGNKDPTMESEEHLVVLEFDNTEHPVDQDTVPPLRRSLRHNQGVPPKRLISESII